MKSPKLISTWVELSKLPPSETHRIEVDTRSCTGWIIKLGPDGEHQRSMLSPHNHYLSTHSFYKENYKLTTKILQSCGFNVRLKNWG